MHSCLKLTISRIRLLRGRFTKADKLSFDFWNGNAKKCGAGESQIPPKGPDFIGSIWETIKYTSKVRRPTSAKLEEPPGGRCGV